MGIGAIFAIFVVSILAMVIGIPAITRKEHREIEEKVVRTKILAVNQQHSGRMNGYFYTVTTFMLYYRDGSHKAVTIRNDSPDYDIYMGKLDG